MCLSYTCMAVWSALRRVLFLRGRRNGDATSCLAAATASSGNQPGRRSATTGAQTVSIT